MSLLILPDCPEAGPIASAAADRPGPVPHQVIPHASGRPWLVGSWAAGELTLITAGQRRLAFAGYARPDVARVTRALGHAGTPHDLDAIARDVPGSYHLLATMDGVTRSQGTVSTARQVFTTRLAGLTVAADSPVALTALTGARLDVDALALRLLAPAVPWPASQRPVWAGLTELPVGCWLRVDAAGEGRPVRWWRPPDADVPLADAAGGIQAALLDAVEVRAGGRGTVSADLSGGLDSTSLCFVAAGFAGHLVTYHWQPMDAANDDTLWADRAAGYLTAGRHRSVSIDFLPRFDDGPADGGEALDDVEGPPPWNRGRAHKAAVARAVAAEGSALHLIGLGGDELFGALPAYLWSLVRKHPVSSLRSVRRSQLRNRWRLSGMVRGLADRTSFAGWLEQIAERITATAPGPCDAAFGWTAEPRMPLWATGEACEAVRRELRAAAATAPGPLDPDRVRHQVVDSVAVSGRAVRQLRWALARFGVDWEAPFLDDQVIEAALAVRVEDRVISGAYKPVLTAAMRGVVPGPVLDRRSKGEFSAEAYAGLHRSRPALLEQCEDLQLARLGLVDAGALRDALLRPGPETRHLIPFESTLSCETWLRSPSAASVPRADAVPAEVRGGTP